MASLEDLPYIRLPLHGKHGEGKFVLVDGDYDGEYFAQFKWYLSSPQRANKAQFVMRPDYQARAKARKEKKKISSTVYLHREVASVRSKGQVASFRDGNHLDCRSRNIIVYSSFGNMIRTQRAHPIYQAQQYKRTRDIDKREAYRGIFRAEGSRKWDVHITHKGKLHLLYAFTSPEAAARAYDELAYKFWGENAVLNFPVTPYLKKKYRKD